MVVSLETDGSSTLVGKTVAITAERRSGDQASLFEKRGATVVHAPTMHTVDLSGDNELRRLTDAIITRPPAWTVATTGFGMRLWFDAADGWDVGDDLVSALSASAVVARGPKAQSACRQRGLEVVWRAPGESMPEVVEWLAGQDGIGDATVAIQLFDAADHPSSAGLRSFAGEVIEIPIYRWRLPDDIGPVIDLARRIIGRQVDAVTFTSQPAVRYLLDVAADEDLADDVIAAFNDGSVLPVCVGPVCATAGTEAGITTMVWPEPFRLAPMVRLAEELLRA